MTKNRSKHDIEQALSAKGFTCQRTDHNYFIYLTSSGKKTGVKTKTSFGHKQKDISGELLSAMARQCKLTTEQFLQLIDCPLSRETYERLLERAGHL